MIQQPKSVALYQAELLASLMQTGIRQTAPGGKARAFCDIVGDQLGELETRSYAAIGQTLLPYASGSALDYLGDMYGVTRLSPQNVRSAAADSNFKFYVLRGTFGNINSGRDITIPVGTQIFTAAGRQICTVDQELTLRAADALQMFSATSVNSGLTGNAPAGVFSYHNFTNYTDSRYGSLLVTNQYGLIGGRAAEDDESYRYRINLKLQSRGGAAEADLRLAVLTVPGIQDVVFTREAGSFTAYVYGISPVVPPSLLALVQATLDARTAFPLAGLAVAPDLLGVTVSTTAIFAPNTSTTDRQLALTAAVQQAGDYVNNLKVGETLVVNEIADRIRNADARILDIGEPNKPLNDIFLWRSRFDTTRYSRYLVGNYAPQVGERLVIESIPDAITIVAA
jgi:uncharacterized phage protein gp47/JayE